MNRPGIHGLWLALALFARLSLPAHAQQVSLNTIYGHPTTFLDQKYSVDVGLSTSLDIELLVDFLDRTGWYSGTRLSIPAGRDTHQEIQLQIPAAVRDRGSCYVAVKAVRPGENWEKKLAELILRVDIADLPVPRPIDPALTLGIPLASFDGELAESFHYVGSKYGHQTTFSVVARTTSAGRPTYAIETSYRETGVFMELFHSLDLGSGAIQSRHPAMGEQTLLPPAQSGDVYAYTQALDSILATLATVQEHNLAARGLIEPVDRYLRALKQQVLATTRDKVTSRLLLPALAGGVALLGKTYPVEVDFLIAEERDILIDVQDRKCLYESQRLRVQPGLRRVTVDITLPARVEDLPSLSCAVKLLALGAPAADALAEHALAIPVDDPRADAIHEIWAVNEDHWTDWSRKLRPGVINLFEVRYSALSDRQAVFHFLGPDGREVQTASAFLPMNGNTYGTEYAALPIGDGLDALASSALTVRVELRSAGQQPITLSTYEFHIEVGSAQFVRRISSNQRVQKDQPLDLIFRFIAKGEAVLEFELLDEYAGEVVAKERHTVAPSPDGILEVHLPTVALRSEHTNVRVFVRLSESKTGKLLDEAWFYTYSSVEKNGKIVYFF